MAANERRMVVGLGNPGSKYRNTRHNCGFFVVDHLAARWGFSLDKSKFKAVYGLGAFGDIPIVLAQPQTFMNLSGEAIGPLAHFYKVPQKNILIVHDDIDLLFGQIKIKEKGGHGGHNGLRSLQKVFGDGSFPRLKIGVGRPQERMDVADYVLGRFDPTEKEVLDRLWETAGDAVEAVLSKGLPEAMNRFNNQRITA